LEKEVVDVKNKKFKDQFLKNDSLLSNKAKIFRELFKCQIESKTKNRNKKNPLKLEELNTYIGETRIQQKIGLNLTKGFGIDKDKTLKNNTKFDELIKEFFNLLVFAVNQPHVHELDSIIETKINNNFDLLTSQPFQEILSQVTNWFVRNRNEFLSEANLNKWFDTLRIDLK